MSPSFPAAFKHQSTSCQDCQAKQDGSHKSCTFSHRRGTSMVMPRAAEMQAEEKVEVPHLALPIAKRSEEQLSDDDDASTTVDSFRDCHDEESSDEVGQRGPRVVHFDEAADTVYEIVPYSEVYGLHPREFVFDRKLCMLPAIPFRGGIVDVGAAWGRRQAGWQNTVEEEDSDSDLEELEDWDEEYAVSDLGIMI